ncbi:MAG: hypothetical protein M1815_004465 [Lichina confinis]|nr:MAG: hypothetical protein M1815_004465 [Lichina confinis]
MELAFSTDPYLTSLPLPRPDILSPNGLSQNTGTAEIFRLPEVRAVIRGDFLVLPCDLVCDLRGEALLEAWMIKQAGLGGETGSGKGAKRRVPALGGELIGRRGGLGVWYDTKGDASVKNEETDFFATLPPIPSAVSPAKNSLLPAISKLAYSIPTDALKDLTEEKKFFPVRHSLLRRYGSVKLRTSYRNAHVYLFPYWILDVIEQNHTLDSISEDIVGWWAKAGWQRGLGSKLGFSDALGMSQHVDSEDNTGPISLVDEKIDLFSMSSTSANGSGSGMFPGQSHPLAASEPELRREGGLAAPKTGKEEPPPIPPILAYVHPSKPLGPLIRRVDTGPLLLSVSLRLARIEAIEDSGSSGASPFAHRRKIAKPSGVAQRSTVTKADCLLDDNVVVEEKCVVKECVVGPNCRIGNGARLTRCLLMEGVVVEDRCQLNGCILGKRSRIGKESVLRDCEVQGAYVVPERTDAKNENFMAFRNLDDIDAFGLDDGEVQHDTGISLDSRG